MNVYFDGTIAPGVRENCSHGGFIPTEVVCDGSERTVEGKVEPFRPGTHVACANYAEELPRRFCTDGDVR